MEFKPPVFLFAFANDSQGGLNLDKEFKVCREELRSLDDNGKIKLVHVPSATLDEVHREFNTYRGRIHVFHFGGHSDGSTLHLLEGMARPENFGHVIGQEKQLKLVFLNGCSNRDHVKHYFDCGVPLVIATSAKVKDERAINLAKQFYQALASGATIEDAFERGKSFVSDKYPQLTSTYCRNLRDFSWSGEDQTFSWGLFKKIDGLTPAFNWKIEDGELSVPTLNPPSAIVFFKGKYNAPKFYVPRTLRKNIDPENREGRTNQVFCSFPAELKENGRLVLLADAGYGKSTELGWLAAHFSNIDTYRVAYHNLTDLLLNRSPLNERPIVVKEKEGDVDLVLLLDGVDETDLSPQVIRQIELLSEEHPELMMIVSCRTEVYDGTLSGFVPIHLEKLTTHQLERYLVQSLGQQKDHFLQEAGSKRIQGLMSIPFYLEKAIEYYRVGKNALPNDRASLLSHFVRESLEIRLKNKTHIPVNDSEREACWNSLKKLAFVMECQGEISVPMETLKRVIDKEVIEYVLKNSSLLHFNEKSFRFAHRMIQEYLAAQALSQIKSLKEIIQIIALPPKYNKIRGFWKNTLTYLWPELVSDEIKANFLNWLKYGNPEVLLKLEPDDIPLEFKEETFRKLYRDLKYERSFVIASLSNHEDFAAFGDCLSNFRFLIQEFRNSNREYHWNLPLTFLRYFKKEHIYSLGKEGFREELFHSILDQSKFPISTRYAATHVFCRFFDNITQNEVKKIFSKYFHSEIARERTIAYIFIREAGEQEQFMESLVKCINEPVPGKGFLVDENYHFQELFHSLRSDQQVLSFFQEINNQFEEGQNSHIALLVIKEMGHLQISERAHAEIFDLMLDHFMDMMQDPFYWGDLLAYLIHSRQFVNFYKLCEEKGVYFSVVSLPPQHIDTLLQYSISEFRKENLPRSFFEKYIKYYALRDPKRTRKLVGELNGFAKCKFKILDYQLYLEQENDRIAYEKSLFLDVEKYVSEIRNVYNFLGTDQISSIWKEVRSQTASVSQKVWDKFPNFVLNRIDCTKKRHVNEVVASVKQDWDSIFPRELFDYVLGTKDMGFTKNEKLALRDWCNRISETFLTTGRIFQEDAEYFIKIVLHFRWTDFPEEIFLSCLQNGVHQKLRKDSYDLMKFCFEGGTVDRNNLEDVVVKILEEGRQWPINYLRYAGRYKLSKTIPALKKTIANKTAPIEERIEALQAYLTCSSDVNFPIHILRKSNSIDSFEEKLIDQCVKLSRKEIEQSLWLKYRQAEDLGRQVKYAKILAHIGNLRGLKDLTAIVHRNKQFADRLYWRSRMLEVKNYRGLKFLFKLFNLSFMPGFEDSNRYVLRQHMMEAIKKFSQVDKKAFDRTCQTLNRRILIERTWRFVYDLNLPFPNCNKPVEGKLYILTWLKESIIADHNDNQSLDLEESLLVYKKIVDQEN